MELFFQVLKSLHRIFLDIQPEANFMTSLRHNLEIVNVLEVEYLQALQHEVVVGSRPSIILPCRLISSRLVLRLLCLRLDLGRCWWLTGLSTVLVVDIRFGDGLLLVADYGLRVFCLGWTDLLLYEIFTVWI